ncbi:MAG: hypothetical protein ABJG78_17055 [Cyclobacteriaceae bacterium]
MKAIFPCFLLILIVSCTSRPEKPRPTDWQGVWKAQWETPPESYPEIEAEFTMTGLFTFNGDSLTVQANGFDGCIFHSDTLIHTQSWYVDQDAALTDSALVLFNDPTAPGMTYRINSKSANMIKLQLLEDIFVTLSK